MTAILADIGGTNTRVALADGKQVRPNSIAKFSNAEFASLEPILVRYLAEAGIASVEGACVAAAGPVRHGVAEMTNLNWVIDHAMLTRATGATKVAILRAPTSVRARSIVATTTTSRPIARSFFPCGRASNHD